MTQRRYWHFHYGSLRDGVLLGPHLRALEMARAARDEGLEATILTDSDNDAERDGIRLRRSSPERVREIRPGDAVVVSEAAAARYPYLLARAGIPFHADCYGFVLPELVQIYRSWSPRRAWIDRTRRALRYQFVAHHAERIYLSHPGQMTMLAGLLFAGRQAGDPDVVDGLPGRVSFLPMGASEFPTDPGPSPYPAETRGRPVFLWGGGIWAWFDLDTLLDAFALARAQGADPVLFFLSGHDHTGLEAHRRALEKVRARAESDGSLGRSVILNQRPVGPADLPGYIRHCRAGVMANPDSLESRASWRTRFLDLVAGGRPLAISGEDPLGSRMAAAGAALRTPFGNAEALARSIAMLASDDALAERMGKASAALMDELSWKSSLRPFRALVSSPDAFRAHHRPALHWPLRYAGSSLGVKWP